jgi:mono/diheme cytochrome c family protein
MAFSTRIFTLTFLLGLTLILSACGSAPAEPGPPGEEPGAASEPVPPTAPAETDTAAEAPSATETSAPAPDELVVATGGVSFQNDIAPILDRSCIRCHGGTRREEGLDMRSYAAMMSGSDNGLVILPGDANGSLLITQVVEGEMPRRAPKLAVEQIQLLVDWVNQGALDN